MNLLERFPQSLVAQVVRSDAFVTRLKNDMFPRDWKTKTKTRGSTHSQCPTVQTQRPAGHWCAFTVANISNCADIQKNYPCPLKPSVESTGFLESGSVEFIEEKSSEGQALRAPPTSHQVAVVQSFSQYWETLENQPDSG